MNRTNRNKLSAVFCVVVLASFILSTCSSSAENILTTVSNKPVFYYNKSVNVRLKINPPEDLMDQRIAAFNILRPILSKKISTANVLWQTDDFSFGKKASISSVYIKDFLDNKISSRKFIEHINLEFIDPKLEGKNVVEPAKLADVSQINMVISSKLREKADLYRINENYESALRIYNQIIELNPNDYISYYWLGEIAKKQNKLDDAKNYFTKALSLCPDFKSADDALFAIIKDNKANN